MTGAGTLGVPALLGVVVLAVAGGGPSATRAGTKSVEDEVLEVSAQMTLAGEAADADRLFSFMLDTDKGSVIQNGVLMATRREALEQVRSDLRGISRIQYRWKRQSSPR